MIEIVKLLEGKNDLERKNIIIDLLNKRGYNYELEEYAFFGQTKENIVISLGEGKKEILVVTHYDIVQGSPGANDNASTIAVIFDVLKKLKNYKPKNKIKFIIFGDEEKDCIGSYAYVKKHRIKNIIAVYNLELVGNGDMIGIWPVTKDVEKSIALKILRKTIKKLGYYFEETGKLPLFYGDYKPFRESGLKNSFCISVIPKKEKEEIRKFIETPKAIIVPGIIFQFFKKFIKKPKALAIPRLMYKLVKVPTFFQLYHSSEDKSKYLSESALIMTSNVLYNTITYIEQLN